MKDPVKRLRQMIAVAVVFLIAYTGIMLYIEMRHYDELVMMDSKNKTEAVRSMIEGYEKTAEEIGRGFCEDENARVRLMTIMMSDLITNGEFTGDRFANNSMVVRVHDGKVELPSEAEGLFPELSADMITGEYVQTRTKSSAASGSETAGDGEGSDEQVILTSGRISGEWYCVRWTPAAEYDAYIRERLPEERLTEAMESVSNVELFIIRTPSKEEPRSGEEESGAILQKTRGLSDYDSIDDLGISKEELNGEAIPLQLGRGKNYICYPVEIEGMGLTIVCCNSIEGEKTAFLGDIIAQILFAGIMLAGLVTWCYSVQWLVRRESLDEEKRKKYSPEVVKKRTTRLAVMSTAVVTMFAFTTVMVQYMYQENRIGSNVLKMLETQIEDEKKNAVSIHGMESERFVSLGEDVSGMLTEDPALLNRDRMAGISEAISAEYLILFDQNAEEAACSREYTGFSLPHDRTEPFYDFRRLINGVKTIVHEPEKDTITGEIRPFVGIRWDVPGERDVYGALVIALPSGEKVLEEENEDVVNLVKQQVYNKIREGNRIIMEIDPETQKIVTCSRETYKGVGVESLGIDPGKLKDRHMCFFYLDDEWYFGVSQAMGDSLYYYLTDSTEMSRTGLLFALISGGLFLIGYILTAKFGFKEYTEENYARYADEMTKESEEYMEKIAKRAPSLKPMAASWRNMLPEMKTKTILQILTGILLVVMVLISLGNSSLARHSALTFVIRGNWPKGINLFSVIAVLVTFCIEYLAYLTVKVIFSMLNTLTDLKGETVFRLVRSFLDYAMFIGAVCVSLSFLGVDTATLLASIGLLSLAISLGAKDIVADILAGLSIVFEKTYNVGDVVEIGGFKGKVLEIGVRSTKLVNGTHDVKTISNHEISNVINYSKQSTVCSVKISVPVTVSVEELKELFDRELPTVRQINPYIINGPSFDGIVEFIDDRMIISISAEGPEEHIDSIRRDLNQALQSMAERELLLYARSDITINLEGGNLKEEGRYSKTIRGEQEPEEGQSPEESGPDQGTGEDTLLSDRHEDKTRDQKRRHTVRHSFKRNKDEE